MALVPADNEQFDMKSQVSNMSYARAQNASEAAKRNLKVLMEKKEKQCEVMRQTLEAKKKQLAEEKGDVDKLYEAKEYDEQVIKSLREEKLLFRVFKQLDVEKKDALSLDNFVTRVSLNDAERAFVQDNLFTVLPTSFTFTFKCREFDERELADFIVQETGFHDQAVRIDVPENQPGSHKGEIQCTIRLAWHSHPVEIAVDPQLSDEENAEKKQLVAAYYESFGGDETSVSPDVAHAKEQEMVEIVKAKAPEALGMQTVKMQEDLRANFSDFISTFWFVVDEADIPVNLKVLHQEAKQIEEETILPEEALDRVTELEHAIKHQQKLNNEILRDTSLTEKDIQAVDKRIDEVEHELHHIQHVTGYDPTNSKKEHVDFALQEEAITQLTDLVKKLEKEHVQGEALLDERTKELVALSNKVEERSEVEEKLYKAKNDLKVATREIETILEETRKLEGDHRKADGTITVLKDGRDHIAVKSLEDDKEYLQTQISKHISAKGESDRVIRAQVLEQRLEVVTRALKDLKSEQRIRRRLKDALTSSTGEDDREPFSVETIMPQKELIDVELYELLNHDLEAITTSMKLKDILLLEKEATIEATELKLSSLQKQKEYDEVFFYQTMQKDIDEVESLKEQYRVRQEAQRREIDALKRGVAGSRKAASELLKSDE